MIGKTLNHYKIIEPLGAGGMGEVYRAHDTTLKRDVAIKVLPEDLAADVERLARLEREAQLLASVSHPGIASVFGLEDSGDLRFIVMEVVEGETLAEQIARSGPVEVEEALELARQIAEALEAAHEKGVIHRDLKPANIKITPDGKVKVLDFGLAKGYEADGSLSEISPDLSRSPTIVGATSAGVILGTAAYMSPEQAKGKPVDKRTDIWAFGCVLYEMLMARSAFEGEDVSETLATILKVEPDWSELPAALPPAATALLRRCLRKDATRRLHDIADARIELEEVLEAPAAGLLADGVEGPPDSVWSRALPWGLAAASLLVTVVAVLSATMQEPSIEAPLAPPSLQTWTIPLPDNSQLSSRLAISPDGSRIVFRSQGMLRMHEQPDATITPLMDTEGGSAPFFSPDGDWIGFYQEDTLKRISVTGGAPYDVCNAPGPRRGATWASDDTIILMHEGGLARIDAFGSGELELLASPRLLEGEIYYRRPRAIPGRNAVIFAVETRSIKTLDYASMMVLDLDTGGRSVLPEQGTAPMVTTTGHLVYARYNTLRAIEFDIDSFTTNGQSVELDQRLHTVAPWDRGDYALAANGTLAYLPGMPWAEPQLVWVDPESGQHEVAFSVEEKVRYSTVDLSPNRQLLAIEVGHMNADILIYDLARGSPRRRLNLDWRQQFMTWMPDNIGFLFRTLTGDGTDTSYWWSVGQGELEQLRLDLDNYGEISPLSISPDGEWLALDAEHPDTGWDLLRVSLRGEPVVEELLVTNAQEERPEYSPDGSLIAYVSNTVGQEGTWVMRASGQGSPGIRVGPGGAFRWGADSTVLYCYYESPESDAFSGTLLSIPIRQDPKLEVGEATEYFNFGGQFTAVGAYYWDIGADGRPLVWMDAEPYELPSEIKVVLNWYEELKRLVPVER